MTDNKQYPELPEPTAWRSYDNLLKRARYNAVPITSMQPGIYSHTRMFTDDQMRAYVDADRAMRAQAAPASQDAATGLKDGDIAALVNRLRDIAIEYSGTQQLRERIASEIRPRAAGLVGGGINKIDSQRVVTLTGAEYDDLLYDAERYRFLRRKFAIVGGGDGAEFHALNLPRPTYIAPDPAAELDAAIDASVCRQCGHDNDAHDRQYGCAEDGCDCLTPNA